MIRRVVTGLDSAGRSAVVIDGPVPHWGDRAPAVIWRTADHPADNSGSTDTAEPYNIDMLHRPGSTFAVCQFSPGGGEAFMHATDTIDYLIILSGQVTLVMEQGEVTIGAGDMVVDRGVMHGWRNDSAEPCVAAVVNLPALPVGAGRTI
jgi:mannose-6-phosphate isomerase-like protein (cupin superfamily)